MEFLSSTRQTAKRISHDRPIVYEQTPDFFALVFGFAFAAFGGLVAAGLVAFVVLAARGPAQGILVFLAKVIMAAMFSFFAVVFSSLGLQLLLQAERFVITGASVTYRRRGLWGARDWTEPLRSFRGVLLQELDRTRSFGDNDPSTFSRILLKHASDRDKDIELYSAPVVSSVDSAVAESEAAELADLLGVPLLRDAGEGSFETRAPGELDSSLAQRAGAGRLGVLADPGHMPPVGRLRRETDADGEDIVVGPLGGRGAAVAGLALAVVAGVMIFSIGSLGALTALMAAVFLALGLGQEVITVNGAFVRQHFRLAGMRIRGTALARAGVKDVYVLRAQLSGREIVRIVGERSRIDAASGFSSEERRWLKEFLLARLASSTR